MSSQYNTKTNAYTSANASIVGGPGMMYNESTTFNNIHKAKVSPPPVSQQNYKSVHKKKHK